MYRYKITAKEEDLMNIFWSRNNPLTSRDIIYIFADKGWNSTCIYTLLRSLLEKELIAECGLVQYNTQYARQFVSAITKEEFYIRLAFDNGVEPISFVNELALYFLRINPGNRREIIDIISRNTNGKNR